MEAERHGAVRARGSVEECGTCGMSHSMWTLWALLDVSCKVTSAKPHFIRCRRAEELFYARCRVVKRQEAGFTCMHMVTL